MNVPIHVALVGCGGRGTSATAHALSVSSLPLRLVAMADLWEGNLINSHNGLRRKHDAATQVPETAKHVGFDAYKQAIDHLRRGDIAILASPAAFRPIHFAYAMRKGIHVFMEPPVAVDGPSCAQMLALAKESTEKNIKVAVGLMSRHCRTRQNLRDQIRSGIIGDILHMRAYRTHGMAGSAFSNPRPPGTNELLWQIERSQSFLWVSGGLFNDWYIHKIDECCWMKGAWPVRAQASGGRHYRRDDVDQNFDNYAVEFTFADGTNFRFYGRTMPGAPDQFASFIHGTKGMAIVSKAGHYPARSRTFKGHLPLPAAVSWTGSEDELDPFQLEWDDFVESIKENQPYNELERGVRATLTACMGRMAAHTGQEISVTRMLDHEHPFATDLDRLTENSPAPLRADSHGRYPVPMPGLKGWREY